MPKSGISLRFEEKESYNSEEVDMRKTKKSCLICHIFCNDGRIDGVCVFVNSWIFMVFYRRFEAHKSTI